MDKTRREMDNFLDLWEQSKDHFTEKKKKQAPRSSFFGMTDDLSHTEVDISEGKHWNDVFHRSLEINGVINEEKKKFKKKKSKKEGFGKDLTGPGKKVKFKVNPIHFSSTGDDSKLRVTPNWTDGEGLRQLAQLKALVYDLETELLGTDVRGGDVGPIKAKLMRIKKQCETLSQKLIPDPKTDVA